MHLHGLSFITCLVYLIPRLVSAILCFGLAWQHSADQLRSTNQRIMRDDSLFHNTGDSANMRKCNQIIPSNLVQNKIACGDYCIGTPYKADSESAYGALFRLRLKTMGSQQKSQHLVYNTLFLITISKMYRVYTNIWHR